MFQTQNINYPSPSVPQFTSFKIIYLHVHDLQFHNPNEFQVNYFNSNIRDIIQN